MIKVKTIALWNRAGDLRSIELHDGLNVITGSSQTGKSALLEIIRFCLGSSELRVPAGPIEETVAYYGLLIEADGTPAFLGRPSVPPGQQTSEKAQLVIGAHDLLEFDELDPNTNRQTLRDWIGEQIGLQENAARVGDEDATRHLIARLPHALLHCFQRQDEIASRHVLFHDQAQPWMPQAIKDTLPYFLGVTGPEQLQQAAQLRELRGALRGLDRERDAATTLRDEGLDEAALLLLQAAEAGLAEEDAVQPESLPEAVDLLSILLSTPPPSAPLQPEGAQIELLQVRRRELLVSFRSVREQRRLAAAIAQGGGAARDESIEQIVRLQPINVLPNPDEPTSCPICEQRLERPVPAVDQLRESLRVLDAQISGVERERPALVAVQEDLLQQEREIRTAIARNTRALDVLAATADAVANHEQQLNLATYVRGRISQYLDSSPQVSDDALQGLGERRERLLEKIGLLERALDPERIKAAAESVLNVVGRRMTELARRLGLEHAEQGVRISFDRLTVVADTSRGPIYMNSGGIGSAKNWVGYHLATVLALQEHFISGRRPVPSLLVLDQPTQAFFPADSIQNEVKDADREDARLQFETIQASINATDGQLQVLVLDHAEFDDAFFQAAVVERWRDGQALIPQAWITDEESEPPEQDT